MFHYTSFICLSLNLIFKPLIMISNSSKRLSKIKKKLPKNDPSDYQFLIHSLSRQNNKQNNPMNKSEYDVNSIKYSIQLNKPSRISSVDKYQLRMNNSLERGQFSKKNLKNSPILLFENVKYLKSSRIDGQNSQNNFNVSKQTYRKNIQFSQKAKSKQITSSVNKKSSKFTQNLEDSFQIRLGAYISFVSELFDQALKNSKTEISNQLSRKRCLLVTLSKELLREISNKKDNALVNFSNKSIEISHFCSFPSKGISKQLQKSAVIKQKPEQNQFKKIIDDLSHKNSKLTQLISQHQRKNIKMFIQMNENESKEIQKCKKYLSSLYDKYKILEKSLIKQNQKYQQVLKKNTQLQSTITNLKKKNENLLNQMEKFRLGQQDKQTISKVSFEDDSHCKMFDFNINQKRRHGKSQLNHANLSTTQIQKADKSFLTKRDKASSCIGIHSNNSIKEKQDDSMSCSTVTKTKNMKKKKQKSPTKVNVKSRLNEMNEEELNLKLKKEIEDLKGKLNSQNKEKQDLQNKIKDLQRKVIKGNEKILKMQKIINEQLIEIQKLMRMNSDMTDHIKIMKKDKQKNEMKEEKNDILEKIKQTQKMFSTSLKKVQTKKVEDEYRIIAMQSKILQQLLNFS